MHITRRGILILLAAAPILAAGTWSPVLQWGAVGLVVLVFAFLVLDWRLASPLDKGFEVKRQHDNRLSLGADNPIQLSVRNRTVRTATFWVRDEPPDAFQVDRRILSGQVSGRKTWEDVYHVHPLQRGDYEFGNLNLRWLGPLGLIIRQGKVD